MKMRTYVLIALLIILALATTFAFAYGPGRGPKMAGAGPAGGPRTEWGPAGPGAWWMTAQPKTAEEKAFLDKVRGLHNEIRVRQLEIARLRTLKGTEKQIANIEKEITDLRARLHETLWNNRELATKLGAGRAVGAGLYGYCGAWCKGCPIACDQCPFKDDCPYYGKRVQGYAGPKMGAPCFNGIPRQCLNCPYRDQCPYPWKSKQNNNIPQGAPAK